MANYRWLQWRLELGIDELWLHRCPVSLKPRNTCDYTFDDLLLTSIFDSLMCSCMDAVETHPKFAIISPDALDSEASWDSALFLRSQYRFLWMTPHHHPLTSLARVFEGDRGMRTSGDPESAFVYRASAISPFELIPTPEQWRTAAPSGPLSVQPGDVVLKRVAPIAAAVVTSGLPALSVDGNFFVIRGLPEADAWWIAFCLNHPACADYLLSKSGRGVLSRVSLSVLRSWTVPATPVGFARLARHLAELLSKRTFLAGQIAALKADVETAVAEQMAATAYADSEERFALRSWSFFFPAALTDTSWLPLHVATEYRSEVLHRDRDWQPLPAYLLPELPSRNRLSSMDDPIPVLRLSDIGSVPLVPGSLTASIPLQANRVFRDPLQPEDVLLSTLGSSPRVAFALANLQPPVYAADHWDRLRFRAHAAAFALILQTGAVTRQLRSLASGSVQQFIRPEDIQRLFLPVLADETLAHWDRSFRSLCKSWSQTDADWSAALAEGWQLLFRAFNLAPHPL